MSSALNHVPISAVRCTPAPISSADAAEPEKLLGQTPDNQNCASRTGPLVHGHCGKLHSAQCCEKLPDKDDILLRISVNAGLFCLVKRI